jgi:fucose permease
MDFKEFQQQVVEQKQLNSFLQETAAESMKSLLTEESRRSFTVTGMELLFAIATYALYRLAKEFFDNRRALNEVKIAMQQEKLISSLIKDGFPHKEAHIVAVTLLKGISKRTEDDPALKEAFAILERGSSKYTD